MIDSAPGSFDQFDERRRYRYMRFGLPLGLTLPVLLIAWLVEGVNVPLVIFFLAFALLIAQAAATAGLTANHVQLSHEGLLGRTAFRDVFIPWSSLAAIELVDRTGVAVPRRLLRIKGQSSSQFFVLDSIEGFDALLDHVLRRASHLALSSMPLWKRLLFLQWGA